VNRYPIEIINLLMETCSTNESSTWDPLARIQHLRKSIPYIGCKSKPLRDHLKNQYLTGNVDCYPKLSLKAFKMIDNFVSDETSTNPTKNRNRGNKERQFKKQDEAVTGAHVHQDKTMANDTKALVLAAVSDNRIIHRNAFEPISSRYEFEDEDMGEVACILIGDHYYPSDNESSSDDESMSGLQTRTMDDDLSSDDEDAQYENEDVPSDPLDIVLIDGQDDSSYETNESMDFDDEFSYDDSIGSNELPSLSSQYSSSSSECSTVANGDIQTVICEASSYICDTDEDSSAAMFTSHDDTVIDNIDDLKVLLDSGATVNIISTRVTLKMEQSVVRYLDDVVLGVPRLLSIDGRPSRNIAHMIDVRQRFGGSVEIVRKEDLYLGGSNTKFTLYKLAPYFNRAGVLGGPDKLDNLRDVMALDIPGAYLYYDPTDEDFQPSNFRSMDFHQSGL
jgi:hypothetical protein